MTFQEELAYDEGKTAGLDNIPRDQWPYPEGCNLRDFYERGFNAGVAALSSHNAEISRLSPEQQQKIIQAGQPEMAAPNPPPPTSAHQHHKAP